MWHRHCACSDFLEQQDALHIQHVVLLPDIPASAMKVQPSTLAHMHACVEVVHKQQFDCNALVLAASDQELQDWMVNLRQPRPAQDQTGAASGSGSPPPKVITWPEPEVSMLLFA